MFASRELMTRSDSDYLTSDSEEQQNGSSQPQQGQQQGQQQRRSTGLQKHDSCDFDFIDQHDQDHDQQDHQAGGKLDEIHMGIPVSAAALKFRASTVLTEKIIAEISDSVRVFRPSKSLHELVSGHEGQAGEEDEEAAAAAPSPTATIDLVVSGGGLKGYFVCGCVSVLQRQLASHNIHIARVSGASAGAWSGFFVCTGITTAMWMESYYYCYDNPHR
jgi:hypothetical protein